MLKSHKKFIIILLIALAALSAAFYWLLFSVPAAQKSDYNRLMSESYDTVFLSMFPTDHYSMEDLAYYRAQTALKTTYSIPDLGTLESYMDKISSSGNAVSTIYLGIRPERANADGLYELLTQYPTIQYHVILSYPSIDYWTDLSEQEYKTIISEYQEAINTLLPATNVKVYLFAKEWLICNSTNYCDTFLINEVASHTMLVYFDFRQDYLLTMENAADKYDAFVQLIEKYRTPSVSYPDLSDYQIVFFGDSIFGNYKDNTSIPGVVQALTGADVYNYGIGGSSACIYGDQKVDSFTVVIDTFLKENTPVINTSKKLCFILHYGLNDYFQGAPVSTDDPHALTSFSGALRTGITSLQSAYPQAQIIIIPPTFTIDSPYGQELYSDVGSTLTEYSEAVSAISTELHLSLLDYSNGPDVTKANVAEYLYDDCHPNEAGRFYIGSRIALKISQ